MNAGQMLLYSQLAHQTLHKRGLSGPEICAVLGLACWCLLAECPPAERLLYLRCFYAGMAGSIDIAALAAESRSLLEGSNTDVSHAAGEESP
jgi:hypothetical protein